MKMKMKKIFAAILAALGLLLIALMICVSFAGCEYTTRPASEVDREATIKIGDKLAHAQATPTDIDFSLERYNLIKRAYWVNGQREKAEAVICQVEKPLGYIVLFNANTVVGSFIVDGKVSSLNSYLTPDSEYYEGGEYRNDWLADVDGCYGENDSGIFFFTPDGKYIEWTGEYLYSDIPFEVADPVVKYKGE